MSISEIIRQRIASAQAPFMCNHNIANFIEPGELELLEAEVREKFQALLTSLVIDTEHDHNTHDTARRVAKMYIHEVFRGRFYPEPRITSFPNASEYDNLYLSGPITVSSVCAHHFQNISGHAWIGIAPGTNVIGLSKFNRIVAHVCERPQIQEELTEAIADAIETATQAHGVAVIVKAHHACMTARGVKEHESDMTTAVMRGTLRHDQALKSEFYALLGTMKGINV